MPTNDHSEYRTLRWDEITAKPSRADAIASALHANRMSSGNGATLGTWVPWIGASINNVINATMWTGEPPAIDLPAKVGDDMIGATARIFDVLARGQTPCPLDRPGMYTHRWFVVRPDNVKLLTDSSVEAWSSMETDTPARISGFWQCRNPDPSANALILMIVYYPNLTAWEESRFWKPLPQGVDQPNRDHWGEIFRKRREITLDSWVTVNRLIT